MSEMKTTIQGIQIIADTPQSKIGYSYPRLFVELVPGEKYINIDLFLKTAFHMPVENWTDWNADTVEVEPSVLAEAVGQTAEILEQVISSMLEETNN